MNWAFNLRQENWIHYSETWGFTWERFSLISNKNFLKNRDQFSKKLNWTKSDTSKIDEHIISETWGFTWELFFHLFLIFYYFLTIKIKQLTIPETRKKGRKEKIAEKKREKEKKYLVNWNKFK